MHLILFLHEYPDDLEEININQSFKLLNEKWNKTKAVSWLVIVLIVFLCVLLLLLFEVVVVVVVWVSFLVAVIDLSSDFSNVWY